MTDLDKALEEIKMNVTTIEMEKDEALKKYKEYLEADKKRKSREYTAARRAYLALSKGLKVIDIYEAFKKTGLKTNGSPKLAIVRADARQVYFTKERNGAGRFKRENPLEWRTRTYADDVLLPAETFGEWVLSVAGVAPNTWTTIENQDLVTNVPFIPPHIEALGKLENYYILFEVKEWQKNQKQPSRSIVGDPYLLKRLSDNTFIVLAEWDVSPVEAIVMRGV